MHPGHTRCVKGGAVDVLLPFRASRRLLTSAVPEAPQLTSHHAPRANHGHCQRQCLQDH
jgi:hypothetical protein